MDSPQDFKLLQEGIQKSLVSTVKSINRIAAEDLNFQRTVNPDVAEQLDDKSVRVLELSARLLESAAKACGLQTPRLEDAEDIDMNWKSVVDVVDSVLERADTALDEYTGLIKRKDPPTADSVGVWPFKSPLRIHYFYLAPANVQRAQCPREQNLLSKLFEMPTSPSLRPFLRTNQTTSPLGPGNRF